MFEYKRINPRLPNIPRWISLIRRYPGESTLRKMEYELLTQEKLPGKLLDFGGGDAATYKKLLKTNSEYASVNIRENMNPTWLLQPGDKLPIPDEEFDSIITLNTLEHVYDTTAVIYEINRVLKPGGKLIITVPWLFRIHASPEDFSRHTPEWWAKTLEKLGFSKCEITPLVWGLRSTLSSVAHNKGVIGNLYHFYAHIADSLLSLILLHGKNGRYTGKFEKKVSAIAPGLYIVAVK